MCIRDRFCCYVCRRMDPKSVEAMKSPLCIKIYAGDRGLRRHCMLKHRHRYFLHVPPEYIEDDAEYAKLCQRERRGQGHKRSSAARTRRAVERAQAEAGRLPDGYVLVPTYDPCCLKAGCQNPVHQCHTRTMSGPRIATGNHRPFQDVQPDRRSTSGISRGTSGVSGSTSATSKGTSCNLKGTSYHAKGTSDRRAGERRTPLGNSGHQVYHGGPEADTTGPRQGLDRSKQGTAGPRQGLGRSKQGTSGPWQDNTGPQAGNCVQPEEARRSA